MTQVNCGKDTNIRCQQGKQCERYMVTILLPQFLFNKLETFEIMENCLSEYFDYLGSIID